VWPIKPAQAHYDTVILNVLALPAWNLRSDKLDNSLAIHTDYI